MFLRMVLPFSSVSWAFGMGLEMIYFSRSSIIGPPPVVLRPVSPQVSLLIRIYGTYSAVFLRLAAAPIRYMTTYAIMTNMMIRNTPW